MRACSFRSPWCGRAVPSVHKVAGPTRGTVPSSRRCCAGDVITPEDVFEVLEEDVKAADLILWVGISFEQSASTAYFRRVRAYLQARADCLF